MQPNRTATDMSGGVERTAVSLDSSVSIYDVSDFVYTRQNIPGPTYTFRKFGEQFEGCQGDACTAACDLSCRCIKRFGPAYDDSGVLAAVDPYSASMNPVYECNNMCKCPTTCSHRVVQNGVQLKLQIFKTAKKGVGVRCLEHVPKNSFVCEYAGEIIKFETAKQRTKNMTKGVPNYILVVKEHSAQGEIRTNVDPTYIGNVGRYLNHSCSPNLYMVPVRVNNDIPHMGLFALRDIQKDEEMCYDYSGVILNPGSSNSEQMNGMEDADHKSECHCQSENCRGFLPLDQSLYED